MDKVVVVTVTFNDFVFLKKALTSLRMQTYPLYKIIVVDNNSNEENKNQLCKEMDDLVEVLFLSENLGGAGGFEKGMEFAQKNYQADWYWLMDADAFPTDNCLDTLLQYKESSPEIGILAPLIYGVDLKEYQLYHHKKLATFLSRDVSVYDSYQEIPKCSRIEADAFVGPLISNKVVEKLGIADGSLFIYGDDLEYTYRISRMYPVLLIRDAVINHRDQPVKGVQRPQNWWKDYYMFRNRIFFINKFGKNWLYKKIGLFFVKLRILKQFILLNSIDCCSELKCIRKEILIKAIIDGNAGVRGKTIDPTEFNKEIEKYVKKN